MRYLLIVSLLVLPAFAAPPSTCGYAGAYEEALCAYQRRDFREAERRFRSITATGEASAQAIRAEYFLARTLMKTGRFDEAAQILIRIYTLDKAFYESWSCDFLLGECRRAAGN